MKKADPTGVKVMSFLVGLSAIRHARMDSGDELTLRVLTVGIIIFGAIAAVGIYRREKWAEVSFLGWAVLILVLQATSELWTPGYQWEEVILGVLFMGTILGVCYAFLRSQLRVTEAP